ncbi:MAG TPA: LytTR family DNA-binding domain-containing protein [Gemmatimonadales bacterium]
MTRADAPLRAVVVDDEPVARSALSLALADLDGIEVVGEAATGEQAVSLIRSLRPDTVFLDIRMPGGDGFSVIERVGPSRMPVVVFVTAYDEFAVRAFEVHAFDYLLKPFEDERLAETVARLRRSLGDGGGDLTERLRALLHEQGEAAIHSRYAQRIMTSQGDRIRFVATRDIDWIEAARNYVRLHTGATRHLVRSSLGKLLTKLDPRQFVRIHRSTIVNVDRIREVQPWFGNDYVAVLQDGQKLKVSRTYRDQLLRETS